MAVNQCHFVSFFRRFGSGSDTADKLKTNFALRLRILSDTLWSGFNPSEDTTWQTYLTSGSRNWNLLGLNRHCFKRLAVRTPTCSASSSHELSNHRRPHVHPQYPRTIDYCLLKNLRDGTNSKRAPQKAIPPKWRVKGAEK